MVLFRLRIEYRDRERVFDRLHHVKSGACEEIDENRPLEKASNNFLFTLALSGLRFLDCGDGVRLALSMTRLPTIQLHGIIFSNFSPKGTYQ